MNLLQNLRIWFAFHGHNRKARQAWNAKAQVLFSTGELEAQLAERNQELTQHIQNAYGVNISRLQSDRSRRVAERQGLEHKLSFFLINYKQELDESYRRLGAIRDRQADCRRQLNAAYDDAKDAQASIESWYRKSKRTPWLFGNARKPLPKHSPFGQSFGDLDSLKSDRARAGSEIERLRARREGLNRDYGSIKITIKELKNQRAEWFRLRQEGNSRLKLEFAISQIESAVRQLDEDIARLKSLRDRFLASEREARGITDLENRISEVKMLRKAYVNRFDDKSEIEARKEAHRQQWIAERVMKLR